MQFFDGWEMNRKIFPSEVDHQKRLSDRFANICNQETDDVIGNESLFTSSQNAALIQYKVVPHSSFIVHVKHIVNPDRMWEQVSNKKDSETI